MPRIIDHSIVLWKMVDEEFPELRSGPSTQYWREFTIPGSGKGKWWRAFQPYKVMSIRHSDGEIHISKEFYDWAQERLGRVVGEFEIKSGKTIHIDVGWHPDVGLDFDKISGRISTCSQCSHKWIQSEVGTWRRTHVRCPGCDYIFSNAEFESL